MIAGCPKCAARYRIDPAKLRPEGARLRCSRCETVFRVQPDPVPAAAPVSTAPAALRGAAPASPPRAPAAAPRSAPVARPIAQVSRSAPPPQPAAGDPEKRVLLA